MRWAANLILLAVLAATLSLGLTPDLRLESFASARFRHWNQVWQGGVDPAPLTLGQGLIPAKLPGPADAWAGGRPHRLELIVPAAPGDYTLTLELFESHEAAPPLLGVAVDGREVARVRVPAGKGRDEPYESARPELTVSVDLTLPRPDSRVTLTTLEGSWLAPATLKLTQGWTWLPAKMGYLLLTRPLYAWGLILALLLAVFLRAAAGQGARAAAFSLILLVVSVGLTLVVVEVGFRLYLLADPGARQLSAQDQRRAAQTGEGLKYSFTTMVEPHPHPEVIYRLKAGLNGYFGNHRLVTNQEHMRVAEPGYRPPEGGLRLVGLGDSVIFGWGVAYDQSLLPRLARALEVGLGRPVGSFNLGCPSYNTAVEVAVYREVGRALRPDAVVMVVLDNDLALPAMMVEPVRLWSLDRSYILQQVRRRLASLWEGAAGEQEDMVSTRETDLVAGKKAEDLDQRGRWVQEVRRYYSGLSGHDAFARHLEDLSAMLTADGAVGLVIYCPVRLTAGDPASRETNADFVLATARRLGLPTLDMGPIYEKRLKELGKARLQDAFWVDERDWHPNAAAHALMAEAAAAKLLPLMQKKLGQAPRGEPARKP